MNRRLRKIAIIALSTPLLYACGDNGTLALIRQATYPPDFNYVSGQELRDSMNNLGYFMQQLDQLLEANASGQSVTQQEVVEVLANIERIGTNLRAGESGSNHPFLADHMSDFVIEVGRARIAAMANPPRYYLAGRVAGGCVNCHRVNRN